MLPDRYSMENYLKAVKNPNKFLEEANRLRKKLILRKKLMEMAANPIFYSKYGKPIKVMEEDWDYLFILDACRCDIFQQTIEIDNPDMKSDCAYSAGSYSKEFLLKTFSDGPYHDTVYVTANGFPPKHLNNSFHDLIFTDTDGFSNEFNKTHASWEGFAPSTVYEEAIKTYKKYPNKRIIIHFMQPHTPYFGDKAEKLRERLRKEEGIIIRQRKPEKVADTSKDDEYVLAGLHNAARQGYISKSELREVYIENLQSVWEYVELLLSEMEGKIVITSDHGELLGEDVGLLKYTLKPKHRGPQGVIGHPPNLYVENVRKVPWVVSEPNSRPTITEEQPTKQKEIEDESINDRLEALGYKN